MLLFCSLKLLKLVKVHFNGILKLSSDLGFFVFLLLLCPQDERTVKPVKMKLQPMYCKLNPNDPLDMRPDELLKISAHACTLVSLQTRACEWWTGRWRTRAEAMNIHNVLWSCRPRAASDATRMAKVKIKLTNVLKGPSHTHSRHPSTRTSKHTHTHTLGRPLLAPVCTPYMTRPIWSRTATPVRVQTRSRRQK